VSSYVLAPLAELDFAEIVEYVAEDSLDAAERLVAHLLGAFERLAAFPRAGHVRLDLAPSEVRFSTVHPYLIIYRADVTPVLILRIISGYRDLVEVFTWGVSEALELETAYA
jgi:plasmid stabilization system protein ParE